jgi:hypothetical protein
LGGRYDYIAREHGDDEKSLKNAIIVEGVNFNVYKKVGCIFFIIIATTTIAISFLTSL